MTFLQWRKILVPFWILFVVSTAQRILKDADLHYTCDESGLHLKMNFDRPFKGLVYVKGYPLDSKCRLPLQRSTTEASFTVPLMACDTVVRQRPETNPWIRGSLVFQQHPLVSTVDDFTKSFICVVQKDTEAPWTEVIKEANDKISADSERGTFLMGSWLDFKLSPELISEEQKASFKRDRTYLFMYVNDGRHFNDMVVTDCIAHRELILLRNSSVLQLTNPNGCLNTSTKTLSAFNIMRNNNGFIVGVYSEINPVQIPSLENSFVSCLAVLCKHKCKCTKNSSPKGHVLIHTNSFRSRISKRSITEPTSSENKTRSIFMKSTMKALAERLKKYRKQSKLLNEEADFGKRFSHSREDRNGDDETTLSLDLTDQYTTEFITEIPEDFEDHDSNTEYFFVNVSTKILPEEEVEQILTKMVEHTTTIKSTTNVTSNDPFPDNYTITLIPDVEFEKKYNLIEQSTIKTSLNDDTTTKVLEESTQNPQDILTTNVTTETKDQVANMTTKAEESHLDQSCTSKLKFVVVTSVLSFVIVCLILISCGLALYLKKEKKKHAIDSYLLYNFY